MRYLVHRSGPSDGESSTPRSLRARLLVLLPLLAASIPPVLIVVTLARYAINVPFGHTWYIVKLLGQAHEGQLRFEHFWKLSYASRPVIPRMVNHAIAWATDMNLHYNMAAKFVVALGVFALMVLLIRRTARPLAPAMTPWMILATSLLIFTPAPSLNWLKPTTVVFMNVLAVIFTLYALARWGQRWPGPALAILGAVAGTLTTAAGLILLVIVPLGLLLAPRHHSGPKHLLSPAIASVAAAVVVSFYFVGLSHSLSRANPLFLLQHPLSFGHYVLANLGAPLGFRSLWPATLWGGVGIATFAWCGLWLWRRSPPHRQALMPWFFLAVFAILKACMTAAGRLYGHRVKQALSSRYIPYSSLFWVSLVVVVALAIAHYVSRPTVPRARKLATVAVTGLLILLGAVSYGKSWTRGMVSIRKIHARHLRGGECLLYYERAPDECLRLIRRNAGAENARRLARLMEKLAVGPFAPSEREWFSPLYVRAARLESEAVGQIDQVAAKGTPATKFQHQDDIILFGWARDPVTRGRAAAVLIVVDGKLVGRAKTGVRRPDVAKALSQNELLHSGWIFRLNSSMVGPGSLLVEAYAVLQDHRRIVKLAGARNMEVIK